MKSLDKRNRINFGLGTIGRDMFYAFESNCLLYFLSDVLDLPVWVFAAASLVLSVMRIFDAFNQLVIMLLNRRNQIRCKQQIILLQRKLFINLLF